MLIYGTKAYWKATLAVSLGSFLVFSLVYSTQPLLPLLMEEFSISPSTANLSLSVTIFAIAGCLLIYGPLSDALGRRMIMIGSLIGAVVVTLLITFVDQYASVLVLRTIQGMLLAGLPAVAMAYLGEEIDTASLGVSMGIYIASNSLGGMTGRFVSGWLAEEMGWRSVFLISGVIGVVLVLIFIYLLPRSLHFQPQPLRMKNALQKLYLHIGNQKVRLACVVGGLHFFVFIGVFNYATFVLSSSPYELSVKQLGLLFLTYFAGSVGSAISGKLYSVLGRTGCMGLGVAIFTCGLLLTLASSLTLMVIGLAFQCLGFFFAHSALANWVNIHAEVAKASAMSLYLVCYYFGGSIGSSYLDLFWQLWGWNGIILGSILVLVFTSCIVYRLSRFEFKERLQRAASSNLSI